ncbi:MAG: UDP-N-acetylmuramate dehydrogenase [Myxococcota bacterium]|nr:UDP-N-acetylmuramate dehydrogenase [Myxococcota bacterium]
MIPDAARRDLEALENVALDFDADTSRLTSLRVGGPVDVLATPEDRDGLSALLGVCRRHGLRHRVIGRGFNTIVRDEGIDGVLLRLSRFRRLDLEGEDRLYVEAGVSHASLTRFCRDRGLSGLEFGAGIPGSLGGWIVMNAGIPGREAGDAVVDVEAMSGDGTACDWYAEPTLRFRYRVTEGLPEGAVVLAAHLRVTPSTTEAVSREIARVQDHRAETQPLDVPTCGSVFRNPEGGHAGALLEEAGLKGHAIGGARVSPTHANFIENVGGASAGDVLALIEHARRSVAEKTGIELVPEVHVLGRQG